MSNIRAFLLIFSCLTLFACKQNVPQMDPKGNGFFDMPWPSDLRISDGVLDLKQFPARKLNLLGKSITDQGIKTVDGFGTNSAIYFSFGINLDETSLPGPEQSLQDTASVMLVNIDPASEFYGARTPLVIDFKNSGTLYRQARLLSLLPRVGFTLEENTQYAAILFSGIMNSDGEPVEPSPLLEKLDQPWDETLGLSREAFASLKTHKHAVMDYVAVNTAWSTDDVVAFTSFTTQNATGTARKLAETVLSLPAEEIVSSVESLSVSKACSCEGCGGTASLSGTIALPRWQSGVGPYLFFGGGIQFDESGRAIEQHREITRFEIDFACLPTPPEGNPYNVDADGTGSSAGGSALRWYSDADFNLTTISVGAYQTGERVDPGLDNALDLLAFFGIPIPDVELDGAVFYNYFNPLTAAHNKLQAASEFVFIKRVLENLEIVAPGFGIQPADLSLDGNAFKVNPEKAGIWGFSQGASSVPIALAMDPTFSFAAINSPSSIAYPQMLYWDAIRDLIETVLIGIQPDELDRFHPVVQMVQTFHEVGDSTNYVPYIDTRNILINAGCWDFRVPRESAEALGLAFARRGLMDIADMPCVTDTFNQEGPSMIEGVNLMGEELIELPFDYANRQDGGTGVFILSNDGHGASSAAYISGDFAYAVTQGLVPYIDSP